MKNNFPKINFIGNKEKLSDWICGYFPTDAKSVFDVFSGGCSIAYSAKKKGYKVITNDILKVNYLISKALIENKNDLLSENDMKIIFSGKPKKGFMYKNFSNKYFFPNECMDLDLYRGNIDKLDTEYKKALAFTLLRRAMIRKMPYSRFNLNWEKIKQLRDEDYSYSKYKRKRAYHNLSIKHHILENLQSYNDSVFDNKKDNIAHNDDAFNLLGKIKADIVYLDPPYTGTMNDYFGFYGIFDQYYEGKQTNAFDNNFIDKNKSLVLFDRLFSKLSKYKYWVLSYNNGSYPSKSDLINIIKKYSSDIKIVEKKHNYQISGKRSKNTNKEYLFIIKNI